MERDGRAAHKRAEVKWEWIHIDAFFAHGEEKRKGWQIVAYRYRKEGANDL